MEYPFPRVSDVFAEGMRVSGAATVTPLDPNKPGEPSLAVAFHLTMEPLAVAVEIECWVEPAVALERRWGFVHLTGCTNDGRQIRATGFWGPSVTATRKGAAKIACSSLDIRSDLDTGPDACVWSTPLLGWEFLGEEPEAGSESRERRRAANLDESLLGDWPSWTDTAWGQRTLRFWRGSQLASEVNGVSLVGELSLTPARAGESHDPHEDFALVYDLISPFTRVYWQPSLLMNASARRILWRETDAPAPAGEGIHRWDVAQWEVQPYVGQVLEHSDLLQPRKRAALRVLARLVAAPDLPIEQSAVSACMGFDVLKAHFWRGAMTYPVSKAAKGLVKENLMALASEIRDEQLSGEFQKGLDGALTQLLRRPIGDLIEAMLADYLGSPDGASAVRTAVRIRNDVTHAGMVKGERKKSVDSANQVVEARRLLWACFLSLVGVRLADMRSGGQWEV